MNERPYLEVWLRRTARQFAVSGRLSQTAAALAASEGGDAGLWRQRLMEILDGRELPSIELLTRIDAILAGPPARITSGPNDQPKLF